MLRLQGGKLVVCASPPGGFQRPEGAWAGGLVGGEGRPQQGWAMDPRSPLSRAENPGPRTEVETTSKQRTQEVLTKRRRLSERASEANAQLVSLWWRQPSSWGHGHRPSTALHCTQ